MNEMLDIMGFAALSAQVLVSEMVKTGWSGTRELVARVFRKGGEESESRQLAMLDQDCKNLLDAPEDQRGRVGEDVQARWSILLAALLQQFPEARVELQQILDQTDREPDHEAASATIRALNNTNSQIVQAAGSISTGGGSITYGKSARAND